jgi:hypothetical protein
MICRCVCVCDMPHVLSLQTDNYLSIGIAHILTTEGSEQLLACLRNWMAKPQLEIATAAPSGIWCPTMAGGVTCVLGRMCPNHVILIVL